MRTTEVVAAIIQVADNLMLAVGANAEVEAVLKPVKRKLD